MFILLVDVSCFTACLHFLIPIHESWNKIPVKEERKKKVFYVFLVTFIKSEVLKFYKQYLGMN